MDTGDRIFYLLDRSGMEQKKFAELIGATDKIVSKWRTSGLKSYRKYLPQIAEVLNTSVDYLVNGEKNPAPSNGSGLTLDDTRYNELSEENRALIDQMIAKLYQAQSDK